MSDGPYKPDAVSDIVLGWCDSAGCENLGHTDCRLARRLAELQNQAFCDGRASAMPVIVSWMAYYKEWNHPVPDRRLRRDLLDHAVKLSEEFLGAEEKPNDH